MTHDTTVTHRSSHLTGALGRLARMPFEPRSWAALVYSLLAFPLGLFYFVFLVTGLPLGVGLLIVWVGFPILALVFAGSWGFAVFERETAQLMLGAEVPPMGPRPETGPKRTLLERLGDHLANRVTWTSFVFLLLKFPLGIASFVAMVTALATSIAFLAAPFLYRDAGYGVRFELDGWFWHVDTLGEALLCSAFGAFLLLVTLVIARGLGALWARLATVMLGSTEHEVAAGSPPPAPDPRPARPEPDAPSTSLAPPATGSAFVAV